MQSIQYHVFGIFWHTCNVDSNGAKYDDIFVNLKINNSTINTSGMIFAI